MAPWTYAAVFAGSLFLAFVLTPVALNLALRRGVLDQPGGHKSHSSPVPYLGGLAMVGAFSVAIAVVALLATATGNLGQVLTLLALAFALGVVGLVDDLYGLHVAARLGVQVAAGVGIWLAGIEVLLFDATWLNVAVTVFWVVGVTNAFNLLDNMDGLSAGVAAIAAVWFFVIAAVNGLFLTASLALALAGCALGFLRHNFHPAKIHMGDAGSLFLGFVLAAVGIKLRFEAPVVVTFLVPVTVLGVAILDTTLVVVSRLARRQSPWMGGRDHISHRLVTIGMPVPAAVGLIYAAAIGHGWAALVMSRLDVATGWLFMGLVIVGDVFLGVLLALVRVEPRHADSPENGPSAPTRAMDGEVTVT